MARVPRTIKVAKKQSGRSLFKRDNPRSALLPGLRISKNHTTYYENRKNRSDKRRRKI